jgi:hypothetical protein
MAHNKEQIDADLGEKEQLSVDDHYCNPDAKIVLISKEKMAFRIDAWLMSRQRSVRRYIELPLLTTQRVHQESTLGAIGAEYRSGTHPSRTQ